MQTIAFIIMDLGSYIILEVQEKKISEISLFFYVFCFFKLLFHMKYAVNMKILQGLWVVCVL